MSFSAHHMHMPRKRSSKRRSSPIAALVAVLVLGSTALVLESYNPIMQESQPAAVLLAQGATPPAATQPPTVQPGSEQAECVSGVDYTVKIQNGSPKIYCKVKWQCPNQIFTSSGTSDASKPTSNHGCDYVYPEPGVPVQPKPDRTLYAQQELLRCDNPSQEEASKVSYCLSGDLTAGNKEECKQIGTCKPGGTVDGNSITAVNHQSMVSAQQALSSGTRSIEIERSNNELLDKVPSSLSEGINSAFEPSIYDGVKPGTWDELQSLENSGPTYSQAELEALGKTPGEIDPLTSDLPVPPQGDLGTQGSLSRPCTNDITCAAANEKLREADNRFLTYGGCQSDSCRAGFEAGNAPPSQESCSWATRTLNFGTCPTKDGSRPPGQEKSCNFLRGLIGGCGGQGQQQQQQQCGYVNGRYICMNKPQCSPIQQMISGCPNAFGQQQCGGLTLMLNKCPPGSHNPNNPSNPYNYPQPTCTINVSPQNAQAGQPGQPAQAVTIQWQSQNAQYANISGLGQVGPSGSTRAYPQGPMTYSMNVVGHGNQQGQCQAQYGAGNGGGGGEGGGGGTTGEVKAEISCQPLKADIGMQVAVSYACQNSSTSVGSGFSTGGALSGSSVVTVAAPSFGQHTVNYGLTCSREGKTHSAQCTIDVNKAAIVLVAVPKTVASGGAANIAWVTSGMEYCTISTTGTGTSTISATSTPTAGSISSGPLTITTDFGLTCETKNGMMKAATTTVEVR